VKIENLKPSRNSDTAHDAHGEIFTWVPPDLPPDVDLIQARPGRARSVHLRLSMEWSRHLTGRMVA
jgi:hypothetical protein